MRAVFCVLLASSLAAAARAEVTAARDDAGRLVLNGPDCAVLSAQAGALSRWSARLGEAASSPGACVCEASGCSVSADSAPEIVRRLDGARPRRWGPNCWNAALAATGVLPELGFSPPAEMTFWTASPLCRRLDDGEAAQAGDVAAIRDASGAELHGYVFVTQSLAFSKNQVDPRSAYELQAPERVFEMFPVPASCHGASSAGCEGRLTFYRCRTLAEFTAQATPTAEYLGAEREVRAIEARLSALAFGWSSEPALRSREYADLSELRAGLPSLRSGAQARTRDAALSSAERFLWESLAARVDAAVATIDWF